MRASRTFAVFARAATRRAAAVRLEALGRTRTFRAYDAGDDTLVMETGVWRAPGTRAAVLVVAKRALKRGARGHLATVTTGNHAVAAVPLLQGRLWDLADVPPARRSETLRRKIVCANVAADGRLVVSPRDVPRPAVRAAVAWLTGAAGFAREDVTEAGARSVAACRTGMASALRYYHGANGVHWLAYPDFHRMTELAADDFARFGECLREIAGTFEGHRTSFLRTRKPCGLHEVELFGISRAAAARMTPALERLAGCVARHAVTAARAAERMARIDAAYKAHLARPALADEHSEEFAAALAPLLAAGGRTR